MSERKFSCIKQVVKTVQIPLPATFISNEISGIAEILESWKRQYKKQLQGVVVNYRHFSLSSPSGFIAPNKPFVYYNVKATFDVFCPKVGHIVKGKINRLSMEHIGCLIEETINATIHLPRYSSQELSPFLNLNREILFEISFFNFDRKMIRVTGKITPKCIQLMRDLFPPDTCSNVINTPELSNNTDEGIGTSSESTDDGLLSHPFDDSTINDDENFKKPLTIRKSKKKSSKKPKNDRESSFIDTSDILTSDEKLKKKKKRKDKTNPDMENHLRASNLSLDSLSDDTLIQNFSSLNQAEIQGVLKEEILQLDDTTVVKTHKKKRKQDFSSTLLEKSTQSKSQTSFGDISSLVLETSTNVETTQLSKKRKRESDSSFMDVSEQLTADEIPKKKKKHKDKTDLLLEKEIKSELLDLPVDDTVRAVCSVKKEKLSPVKAVNDTVHKHKKRRNKDKISKDKNKDKKSKDISKSKKKKEKVLASGAVLKKDKKSHAKDSKKNKLHREHSKKHKKDKSGKKKKGSDGIKSEID